MLSAAFAARQLAPDQSAAGAHWEYSVVQTGYGMPLSCEREDNRAPPGVLPDNSGRLSTYGLVNLCNRRWSSRP